MKADSVILTIAILGGTGKEGRGLAYRWAKAGYRVLIGSRQIEKAQATAREISNLIHETDLVSGMTNEAAAGKADIAVLSVPYQAQRATLEGVKESLKGKILVDVIAPLVPPKVNKVQMPESGSASQEAKQILGEEVEVVAAFQNISHELLLKDEPLECDVLVTGSSKAARAEALKLVAAAGLTGWDAGPIENSVVVEGLTSVLININKQYGSTYAGIKITGANQP